MSLFLTYEELQLSKESVKTTKIKNKKLRTRSNNEAKIKHTREKENKKKCKEYKTWLKRVKSPEANLVELKLKNAFVGDWCRHSWTSKKNGSVSLCCVCVCEKTLTQSIFVEVIGA